MALIDEMLVTLLRLLKERNYGFVTVTPATHARVTRRPDRRRAHSLEDVLGWNLPFPSGSIDPEIEKCLHEAEAVESFGSMSRSLVRVSSLHNCLYLHSAYPTIDRNAAFFGPDSYRFADLIMAELSRRAPETGNAIVDIGTGVGVGAITLGRSFPRTEILMTEINQRALNFAMINAAAAGVTAMPLHTIGLEGFYKPIDVAMANPPYLMDDQQRLYRDGGRQNGSETTIAMASIVLPRLADRGRFILYSGSAIVSGVDRLKDELTTLARAQNCRLRYWELDPDVFGEELERPQYAHVERIALVAAIFERD